MLKHVEVTLSLPPVSKACCHMIHTGSCKRNVPLFGKFKLNSLNLVLVILLNPVYDRRECRRRLRNFVLETGEDECSYSEGPRLCGVSLVVYGQYLIGSITRMTIHPNLTVCAWVKEEGSQRSKPVRGLRRGGRKEGNGISFYLARNRI